MLFVPLNRCTLGIAVTAKIGHMQDWLVIVWLVVGARANTRTKLVQPHPKIRFLDQTTFRSTFENQVS
jgi:hypothetical protein